MFATSPRPVLLSGLAVIVSGCIIFLIWRPKRYADIGPPEQRGFEVLGP
jgi:hypothetical protein